jgi:sugar phosphate isomerase/epimerase
MTSPDTPRLPQAPPIALCWGTVIGAPLETLVQAAGRAGLGAVTLTARMYERSRAAGASDAALRRQLADHGVRVHAIDPLISALPGTPRPADVPAGNRDYFEISEEDCYRAAEALGAESVNLAHFGGGQVSEPQFIECIGALAERARRRGVRVTLEFLPESAIPDLATAQRIVRGAGGANLGVMFDTWHFARSGGTLAQLAALPAGLIAGVQISDRRAGEPQAAYRPMSGRLLPGEGELPLVEMLSLLLSRDPNLTIGVEVFSDNLNELPADEVGRRVAASAGRVIGAATRALRAHSPPGAQPLVS